MLSQFKSRFNKRKISSPMENVARLKGKARKLGLDDKSLITSMGGIETKHHDLYKRVAEAENYKNSKTATKWAVLTAIVTTIVGGIISNLK